MTDFLAVAAAALAAVVPSVVRQASAAAVDLGHEAVAVSAAVSFEEKRKFCCKFKNVFTNSIYLL